MIPGDRSSKRWVLVLRSLAPFARSHRRLFLKGILAALLVVGFRLALPWPFRLMIDPWVSGQTLQLGGALSWIPIEINPVIALGGVFFLLLLGVGYADFVERVNFARFAIGLVKDLRVRAFSGISREDTLDQSTASGDLVARLIGDTARIKAGLQGFLVHVATNGLLFAGVIIILIWMNLALGLIFASAGLIAGIVAAFGASRIFRKALKHRKKEGKLAKAIERGSREDFLEGRFAKVNRSSELHEASLTRLQGLTTWFAHGILGVAVIASLWVGVQGVPGGRLSAGDMFVFFAYVLMLRGPMVQLTRQGGRTGKIIAAADRVVRLLSASEELRVTDLPPAPLRDRLQLVGVKVSGSKRLARRRMIGPIDLDFPVRQRTAIVGEPGSGKTALLELIAGHRKPSHGHVLWDGVDRREIAGLAWSQEVAYLPEDPSWRRRAIREFLGLPNGDASKKTFKIMRRSGAQAVVHRRPAGLDSKVGSADLSFGERRALGLARIILSNASLWLLDDPAGVLSDRKAKKMVNALLDAADQATVIATFNRPDAIERFDRVIELRRGRIVFDGRPAEWLKQAKSKVEMDLGQEEDTGANQSLRRGPL